MNTSTIKFSYHRDPKNPKRILTIARKLSRCDDEIIVRFGCSICSPKDKFTKKAGRDLAVSRMNNGEVVFGLTLGDREHPKERVIRHLDRYTTFRKFFDDER